MHDQEHGLLGLYAWNDNTENSSQSLVKDGIDLNAFGLGCLCCALSILLLATRRPAPLARAAFTAFERDVRATKCP